MSRFLIQSVMFDNDDGTITVTYLDKDNALRSEGAIMVSACVSVSPDAGPLYSDLADVRSDVESFLDDVVALYRNEPAFIPGDTDEDEDEKGMGY